MASVPRRASAASSYSRRATSRSTIVGRRRWIHRLSDTGATRSRRAAWLRFGDDFSATRRSMTRSISASDVALRRTESEATPEKRIRPTPSARVASSRHSPARGSRSAARPPSVGISSGGLSRSLTRSRSDRQMNTCAVGPEPRRASVSASKSAGRRRARMQIGPPAAAIRASRPARQLGGDLTDPGPSPRRGSQTTKGRSNPRSRRCNAYAVGTRSDFPRRAMAAPRATAARRLCVASSTRSFRALSQP